MVMLAFSSKLSISCGCTAAWLWLLMLLSSSMFIDFYLFFLSPLSSVFLLQDWVFLTRFCFLTDFGRLDFRFRYPKVWTTSCSYSCVCLCVSASCFCFYFQSVFHVASACPRFLLWQHKCCFFFLHPFFFCF